MPKVSILVPIYNVEQYIQECLASLVKQTLKDIEIICINDGSTDNSLNIIKEFAHKDVRVKIINKANSGYGSSMNIGLANAIGEYIGIVESDDFVSRNMFEELYDLAKKSDCDMVKSDYYDYCSNPKQVVKHTEIAKYKLNKVISAKEDFRILKMTPSIWSGLYKKEFLTKNNIRFFEHKGTAWVDNPFQLKTFYLAQKIVYDPTPYYHYRNIREDNASSLSEGISIPYIGINDINKIIKKYSIKDPEIFKCLSIKIIAYIDIIITKLSIKNSNIAIDSINKMLDILRSYHSVDKKVLQCLQLKNQAKLFKYILRKKTSQMLKIICKNQQNIFNNKGF